MNPTLKGFLRKELVQALRDPRMRVVLFLMPVIQMSIFGLALSNEVRNIRFAVAAAPDDTLAQQLRERAVASGWFRLVHADGDPYRLVRSGRAEAVFIVPPGGLTRAVERGGARAQLLVDAANAVRARSVENYVQRILRRVLAEEGRGRPQALAFDVRVLYNPSMETAVYLVPGVLCMILCVLTIILTSMSLAREKEMGTFETLIAAPVSDWEILLGKTLPYIFLGMLDVPLVLAVAVFAFKVPLVGPVWQLGLASLAFVACTVSIGTLISTFAKNQQQAMMGGFLFMFPAIQLSGVMAPLENIPELIKPIIYLNPLQYFVTLLRTIMLKGGAPAVFWPNLLALVAMAGVSIALSVRRFRQTLN